MTTNDKMEADLRAAAMNGDEAALTALLDAKIVDIDGVDSCPAVMCAARFGHEGCLDRLVAAGGKLDLQDTNELTAVMCAADKGSEACLSRLVAAGGKFDLRNTEGDTAVMYAADKGHVGCVRILEAAGCR